jgi:hypothetical protein
VSLEMALQAAITEQAAAVLLGVPLVEGLSR